MIFKLFKFAIILIATCAFSTGAYAKKSSKKRPSGTRLTQRWVQAGPAYAEREDAMRLADDIALRRDLPQDWVRQVIGQASFSPQSVRFMQPAPKGTPKNWRVYRSRFIDRFRLQAGLQFWRDNREVLARAEQETGVPAQIIVGIIGVETIYGQQMGNFSVLDALTTLALDFPADHPRAADRSAYFRSELEQYLSLVHRADLEPGSLRGSYAGAMGMAQFMPSSWVKYAVDFDGDGKIDLFNSAADVIGSVANYFVAFGWQSGLPTHYPVHFDVQLLDLPTLLAPDIVPTFNVDSFLANGAIVVGSALQHPGLLALVELQNGNAPPSYVAGTQNFFVITRYNWSSYYALAVIELGEEVSRAMAP